MEKIEKVTALVLEKQTYEIIPFDSWDAVAQLRKLVIAGHAKAQYREGNRWCDYGNEKDFTNPKSTSTYDKCLIASLKSIDGDMVTIVVTVNYGDMFDGYPTGEILRKFEIVAPLSMCTEFHAAIDRKFLQYVESVYEKRQEEALRKKLEKISAEILKSL